MFPDLKFVLKYYEMGAAYQGEFVCEGGKVLKDEAREYCGDRGG